MTAMAERRTPVGLVAFMATAAMLFTAFTASYVMRRAASDWSRVPIPAIFWINTVAILGGSVTLERARRAHPAERGRWVGATFALGIAFLVGQAVGWHQLRAGGFFLSGSPHASFLYVLTGAHGLHLIGGLVGLGWAAAHDRIESAAVYWHFMGGIWIWVLLLLSVA